MVALLMETGERSIRTMLLRCSVLALCVALLLVAGPRSADAQKKYPTEVYQAILIFSLFTKSRHVRILHNRLKAEEPSLYAHASAPAAASKLGFKAVKTAKSLPKGDVILAKKDGAYLYIAESTGRKAIKRFVDGLIKHPRFEQIFDRYIDELKFSERVLIRPLQLALSRQELTRKQGLKFVLDKVKELSGRNLRQLRGN